MTAMTTNGHNGLKLASDSATEGGGKATTSRNIFDEGSVLKKVTWSQWLKQECNKANFSNLLTFLVTAVGLVLRITQGKDDLFARCVLSAGLFGFSGGVTNAIAVKMLFDKIYVAPGVSLIGSGIIENKFKEIRTTLKNTMMKSFFVLDYMKGYIERAVPKVSLELQSFVSSADFESLLSTALEKALSSEAVKDVPEEMRPLCSVLLEDFSQHMSNGVQSTSEDDVGEIPSVACLKPHLALVAKIAAPILQEQMPRVATSPSVLPLLRKEAEASIRSSIEAQGPLPPTTPADACFSCSGTPVRHMLDGSPDAAVPEAPTAHQSTWGSQFYHSLKHSVADKAVGYVINDEFPTKVHRAVSKVDVEPLLLAAANSDEFTVAIDKYVRSKVGNSWRRADFFRRTLTALQHLLEDSPGSKTWPPHIPLSLAKITVTSLFDAAVPHLEKSVPLLVTEENVHRMRVQIDKLLEERLQSMSKAVVKRMVEDVMRQHCQWLIVWGNVFGGMIGVISTLCGY